MPAYNQSQVVYNAQNANSVAILIGEVIVAFAQTVGHSYGLGTQAIHGIGSRMPQEIQQMAVMPRISIDTLALTPAGIANLAGTQNIAYILSNNEFDIHITVPNGPGNTGAVFMTYEGCQAENFSSNIPANGAVTETISFIAMDVLDANGDSILAVATDAFDVPAVLGLAANAANIGLSSSNS